MSQYHTQAAWQTRLEQRYRSPTAIPELVVFYHAALLPDWQIIVREQFDLLRHVGIDRIKAGVLGTTSDVDAMVAMAESRSIAVDVVYASQDFTEYENPTLQSLWEAACKNPTPGYVYFHTKGASLPHDATKRRWRRIMQRYTISEWRSNLMLLSLYDIVGVNWQNSPNMPHFQGNFWTARGDWLANLDEPRWFRAQDRGNVFAGQSWRRMHAEAWLGSKPWHHIDMRGYWDLNWYVPESRDIDGIPWQVDGFDYGAYDA